MEKEKVLQILDNLTKYRFVIGPLSRDDYGYIMDENEVVCFSHSSTDGIVIRIKEITNKLGEDLINTHNDYDRFIMIIECNPKNEMMMAEMEPIQDFYNRFIGCKKLLWGLSQHNDIEGVKITIVASR